MPQTANNYTCIFNADSAFIHQYVAWQHAADSVKAVNYCDSLHEANTFTYSRLKSQTVKKSQHNGYVKSVFSGHLLNKRNFESKPSQAADKTGITIIITMVIFCIALVRQYNNRRLAALINAFKAARFAVQLQREEYSINNRAAIILLFVFVITLATLLTGIIDYYFPYFFTQNYLLRITEISAGILIVYMVKLLSINLLGFIFDNKQAAKEYTFNILLFSQIAGVFLIPVVLVMLFSKQIGIQVPIYAAVLFLLFTIIFRIWRTVIALRGRQSISGLYIFLYLCTLEILPVVFVVKYFEYNY